MMGRSLLVLSVVAAGMLADLGGRGCFAQTPSPAQAGVDLYGDPLPPGALARLGTVRFRPVDPVLAAAQAPDGKTAASLDNNGWLCLWDADSGKPLRRWRACRGPGKALAFSPDSRLLASAGGEGPLRVWEAASGKEVGRPGRGRGLVLALAFSPNGKSVAAGKDDGSLQLIETTTGKPLGVCQAEQPICIGVSFSPDGKTVAAASMDTSVLLWEISSGKQRRLTQPGSGQFYSVAFSPDGKSVAASSDEGWLCLWDAATGKPLWQTRPSRSALDCLAFSADGKVVAAACDDTLHLHDTAAGRPLRHWQAHDKAITALSFSPDGKRILSAARDGLLRLWETAGGKPIEPAAAGHLGAVWALAFTADGKSLVSGGQDGTLRLWQVDTGKLLSSSQPYTHMVGHVCFSPNGKLLASTGNGKGDLCVWEVKERQLQPLWKKPDLGHRVAMSPDSTQLATAAEDGRLRLWEAAGGKLLRQWEGQASAVCSVAFAPDGRVLASTGLDGNLRLWEAARDKPVPLVPLEGHWMWSVLYSPDGSILAAQEQGSKLALLETATFRIIHSFPGEQPCFSPRGQMVAAAGREGTLHLWDAISGAELTHWAGHGGRAIFAMAFSPDGKRLASGSQDGTVLIWDVQTLLRGVRPPAASLAAKDLEPLWETLGSRDGARAYRAIGRLAAAPDLVVPFLRQRLGPVAGGGRRVARLLEELDSDEFAVREKAMHELEKLGGIIEPALARALDGTSSPEAARRIRSLLSQIRRRGWTPDHLRVLRAVTVLGRIGNKEARQVLEKLAEGVEGAQLTRAARGALICLQKTEGVSP